MRQFILPWKTLVSLATFAVLTDTCVRLSTKSTSVQAAIIDQPLSSRRGLFPQNHISDAIDIQSANHPPDKRKFILLTNGNEIKLYPLEDKSSGRDFTSNHYVIKSLDVDFSSPNTLYLRENNTFTRHQLEKNLKKLRKSRSDPKEHSKFILPGQVDEEDGQQLGGSSDWKKPLIIDVDFFFDDNFCNTTRISTSPRCLVIVWLDKRNSYVHYGAINTETIPTTSKSTSKDTNSGPSNNTSSRVSRIRELWIEEFPPYDICSYNLKENATRPQRCNVYAMVVDKKRGAIHVAFSSESNSSYPNRLLSGTIRSYNRKMLYQKTHLIHHQVLSFNDACENRESPTTMPKELNNLFVDEVNGDWLFYLDKQGSQFSRGAEIIALNVYSRWATLNINQTKLPKPAVQISVQSIKLTNPKSITLDKRRRLLLWLTDSNELFTCGLSGENVSLVGRLSSKPTIRSPSVMQVHEDFLYISDTLKKVLIAYPLDTNTNEADLVDLKQKQISAENKTSYERSPDKSLKPTHEVLLVETPALYGFRVVDFEAAVVEMKIRSQLSSNTIGGEDDEARRCMRKRYDKFIDELNSMTSLCKAKHYLTRKIFNYGLLQQKQDEYDQLLDRSYDLDLFCGYNQLNQPNHNRARNADEFEEVRIVYIILLVIACVVMFGYLSIMSYFKDSTGAAKIIVRSKTILNKSYAYKA